MFRRTHAVAFLAGCVVTLTACPPAIADPAAAVSDACHRTTGVASGYEYSDDEWNAHVEEVRRKLVDAPTTEELYRGPDGIWSIQRVEQQNDLMDDLWQREAADAVPREGKAIVIGGVSGAGKTTALERSAGVDRSQYFAINPDDVKDTMAARGMIPVIDGLSPMEASTKAHEEASMLAKHLADRAYRNRTNAIWDITMNSPDSVTERIVAMRTAGYIEVDGVFANVPLDIARMRAMHRWRQGQETYRAGTGCGGRYVPEDFIDASTPDVPGFSSRNEEVFEMVRGQFDSTVEGDTSDPEPLEISATGPRWAHLH
ncbi:MAG TPA: zeta toxin family protein [Mycobacterium sp.]|nr:zeta toxin family protein [Mycobacterium sp.]HQC78270.1 zeta toxin family protein [Mycobacterium sp.]